jgi:hypothetical protein
MSEIHTYSWRIQESNLAPIDFICYTLCHTDSKRRGRLYAGIVVENDKV